MSGYELYRLKAVIKLAVITSSQVCSSSASIAVSQQSSGTATLSAPQTKAQMTADAIAEAASEIDGLDVGDTAMIESMDFDDFN